MSGSSVVARSAGASVVAESAYEITCRAIGACLCTLGEGNTDAVKANVSLGVLQVNVFSMGFSAWIESETGTRALFVRIPKDGLRRSPSGMLRISARDRRLAIKECGSLEFVAANWLADDLSVFFVKPATFSEDYNAIVTEYTQLLRMRTTSALGPTTAGSVTSEALNEREP